ncbi:DoxX family protein [Streptomyces monticola]|uniref:DoxX family protein n=1 Tax=Streptomyces monticola TaxID=2666263 RepID=A0ABW2JTS5_9ACTN
MAVLRRIARPMLASTFVTGGLKTLWHPEQVAGAAEPVAVPVAERVAPLPESPEQLVRINSAVQVGAGTLLALGRFPRASALALAATLVPTTLAGHPFWTIDDPDERAAQRIHFLKNLSMLGGLLITAADTHGKPSLARQARRSAHQARRSAGQVRKSAQRGARRSARAGRRSAEAGRRRTRRVAARSAHRAQSAAQRTPVPGRR